ncbi:glycosyltransferase family 9 protein [Shewanella donghaensis]|uniref:glycosyltransferase family 9 protein n=1 Tax=Shewanella donghaensis TaxID=238836 RepID=UPI001183E563|nr:glycosyltransferase family 9 protein [Shewanella donghaensis]
MKKILYIRHDKIGDFTTKWPALSMLKQALPDATIDVFVAPVVKSFALACPHVDNVIIDTGDDDAIAAEIKAQNYDAAIVSLSQYRVYKLLKNANIPYKLVPTLNWYQYLYKHRTNAQYQKGISVWKSGCNVIEHFLKHHGYDIPKVQRPFWNVIDKKQLWQQYYNQQGQEKLIFAHPGTGGSSGGLPIGKFSQMLADIVTKTAHDCRVVITYSGDEKIIAQEMHTLLVDKGINVDMAKPLSSLSEFAESLVAADMFIAGSTGPLHLAGLHNVPTVGFYAGRRSAPHIRWQSLSADDRRLAYTPPVGKRTGRNMSLIDFDRAATEVADFLDSFYAADLT